MLAVTRENKLVTRAKWSARFNDQTWRLEGAAAVLGGHPTSKEQTAGRDDQKNRRSRDCRICTR